MLPDRFQNRWRALITVYLLIFDTGLLMFFVPPLRSRLPHGLALAENDPAFGWIQSMMALPAALFALGAGIVLDRWNTRRAGICGGLLLLGGNFLFNIGFDFSSMLLGRFLVGTGAILLHLTAAKIISIWFSERQKGLAMSVLHTAWPAAAILTFSTFVLLGRDWGWQATTLFVNLFVAATLAVFAVWSPTTPEDTRPVAADRRLRNLLEIPRDVWLVGIFWFCFSISTISILTFGPDFFTENGWGMEMGSFLIGMIMWTAVAGAFAAGWMMDRFGELRLYIVIPALLSGLCIFGLLLPIHPMPLMLSLGFLTNFVPVAIYALIGTEVSPARLGLAFGITLTLTNIGNVIGPVLAGLVNKWGGSRAAGMVLAASLALFSLVWAAAVSRQRMTGKRAI
jgi:predicted MFS family arabinose efflux permease